jgi:hypothetical protein
MPTGTPAIGNEPLTMTKRSYSTTSASQKSRKKLLRESPLQRSSSPARSGKGLSPPAWRRTAALGPHLNHAIQQAVGKPSDRFTPAKTEVPKAVHSLDSSVLNEMKKQVFAALLQQSAC